MNLEELVKKNYDKLNENDFYIWKYIIYHKEECKSMSIQELAEKCNVSHTTILRFAHKLGLDGYSEMKVYLKWESKSKVSILDEDIEKSCQCIEKVINEIKNRDFDELFEFIDNAENIYVYGSGEAQKNAAKELKRVMLFSDKLVYNLEGRSETKIILESITDKDLFFMISLSGENSIVNDFAYKLKEKGAKVVSITIEGNNELASISDFSIQFYSHSIMLNGHRDNYYGTTQFFIINELLMLKYLKYISNK